MFLLAELYHEHNLFQTLVLEDQTFQPQLTVIQTIQIVKDISQPDFENRAFLDQSDSRNLSCRLQV